MNIVLWVVQVLLALHTLMGALWKFSSSPQMVPSLAKMPPAVWAGLSALEIILALALVVPAFIKPISTLVPVASVCIAVEMVSFIIIHLMSGNPEHGQMIYWAAVAAVCAFLAYGRFSLSRFQTT